MLTDKLINAMKKWKSIFHLVHGWGILSSRQTGISKAYGDRILFENMNFALPPGGIIGIIGPNGAGKTTLFKLITEHEQPDEGTIKIGDTVKLAYVDQMRPLDPDKTIWQEISGGEDLIMLGNREVKFARVCGNDSISAEPINKNLSGTLRRREEPRSSCKSLKGRRQTYCCLMKPTNDLDVNTLRALEEALY